MLPSIHSCSYKSLILELESLKSRISPQAIPGELIGDFQSVQRVFQCNIVSLTSEELNPELMAKWQSLHTEVYRTFKLLETEMMFLRSSTKSTTIAARLTTIQGRIEKLITYTKAILEL